MDKKTYELTVILPADVTQKKIETLVKGMLAKSGGKILKYDFLGKKQLMYPIRKEMQGVYGYFELEMTPTEVVELQKRIKLEEGLYRQLLVIKNMRAKEEKKPAKSKKVIKTKKTK